MTWSWNNIDWQATAAVVQAVGSVVAIGAAIYIDQGTTRRQRFEAEAAEANLINGYLGAIEAEIDVLWQRYCRRLRSSLEALPEGAIFDVEWPVRHDYFTVYSANAHLLGRVPDACVRKLIVETYTSARGMLDSLSLNTEMLHQLAAEHHQDGLIHPAREARINELQRVLADYAVAIRESDREFGARVTELLTALRTRSDRMLPGHKSHGRHPGRSQRAFRIR